MLRSQQDDSFAADERLVIEPIIMATHEHTAAHTSKLRASLTMVRQERRVILWSLGETVLCG